MIVQSCRHVQASLAEWLRRYLQRGWLAALLLWTVLSQGAVAQSSPSGPLVITTPTPTPTAQPAPAAVPMSPAAPPGSYVVQPGDTLLTVALEMGRNLDEMGCLLWPDFRWEQPLVIGELLQSLPAGVLCHQVAPGETVAAIAARYGVSVEAMRTVPWNRLQGEPAVGDYLRVPIQASAPTAAVGSLAHTFDQLLRQPVAAMGGRYPLAPSAAEVAVPLNWPYGSGRFAWPLYGWLTQSFADNHRGIDLGAPAGTLVTAADRGVVIRAGWNNQGYGRFVIVDHRIDYITLYAHLDAIYVQPGQVVARGQALGTVGSTGNSTGPHLHFEIRDFGVVVDPLPLLDR